MTRKELEDFAADTPDDVLAKYGVYETAAIEAHVAQANAADAKVAAALAEADAHKSLTKQVMDELGGEAAVKQRLREEKVARLTKAKEQADAALAAALGGADAPVG